jgi:hypothetical protein
MDFGSLITGLALGLAVRLPELLSELILPLGYSKDISPVVNIVRSPSPSAACLVLLFSTLGTYSSSSPRIPASRCRAERRTESVSNPFPTSLLGGERPLARDARSSVGISASTVLLLQRVHYRGRLDFDVLLFRCFKHPWFCPYHPSADYGSQDAVEYFLRYHSDDYALYGTAEVRFAF